MPIFTEPVRTFGSATATIGSTIALDAGGGAGTVDASLDSASHNPVENRAIWSALSGIGELLDRI